MHGLFDKIQLGLDLATSISIVVAAISFIHAQSNQEKRTRAAKLSQAKNTREEAIKNMRISQMSKLIADLSGILTLGDKVVEKVRQAQAGRPVDLIPDDFTGFCITVDRYIRINSQLLFNVWAKESEKQILEKMKAIVASWSAKFVAAAVAQDMSAVPDFPQLLDDLNASIFDLSSALRAEIDLPVSN